MGLRDQGPRDQGTSGQGPGVRCVNPAIRCVNPGKMLRVNAAWILDLIQKCRECNRANGHAGFTQDSRSDSSRGFKHLIHAGFTQGFKHAGFTQDSRRDSNT